MSLLERFPCEFGGVCAPDCQRAGCPYKLESSLILPAGQSETLGSYIRDLRRIWGMTQRELAEAVGVTFADISGIENGRKMPDEALIDRIAHELCARPQKLHELARRQDEAP